MQAQFPTQLSTCQLIEMLDEYPAGVDAAFDSTLEELEWEFAVRRLNPTVN